MKIYIVEGNSGSYEDNQSWIVAAYKSKVSAQNKEKELKEKVDEAFKIYDRNRDEFSSKSNTDKEYEEFSLKDKELENKIYEIDPLASSCDITFYNIIETELED